MFGGLLSLYLPDCQCQLWGPCQRSVSEPGSSRIRERIPCLFSTNRDPHKLHFGERSDLRPAPQVAPGSHRGASRVTWAGGAEIDETGGREGLMDKCWGASAAPLPSSPVACVFVGANVPCRCPLGANSSGAVRVSFPLLFPPNKKSIA